MAASSTSWMWKMRHKVHYCPPLHAQSSITTSQKQFQAFKNGKPPHTSFLIESVLVLPFSNTRLFGFLIRSRNRIPCIDKRLVPESWFLALENSHGWTRKWIYWYMEHKVVHIDFPPSIASLRTRTLLSMFIPIPWIYPMWKHMKWYDKLFASSKIVLCSWDWQKFGRSLLTRFNSHPINHSSQKRKRYMEARAKLIRNGWSQKRHRCHPRSDKLASRRQHYEASLRNTIFKYYRREGSPAPRLTA